MSQFRIIADVHVANHRATTLAGSAVVAGVNGRCAEILRALALAAGRDDHVVVAGDLVDVVGTDPRILARVRDILYRWKSSELLLGNHDRASDLAGDHGLGPLADEFNEVIENMVIGEDVIYLPHIPGTTARELIEESVVPALKAIGKGRIKLLVGHFGIADHDDPSFMLKDGRAILSPWLHKTLAPLGITHVAAGDWHRHKVFRYPGFSAWQIGALAPVGWRDPGGAGLYGSVLTWDGETLSRREVPGPRFIVGPAAVVDREADRYLSTVDGAEPTDIYARVTDSVEALKIWLHQPETFQVCEDVPTAARAARTAEVQLAAAGDGFDTQLADALHAWAEERAHPNPAEVVDGAMGLVSDARRGVRE